MKNYYLTLFLVLGLYTLYGQQYEMQLIHNSAGVLELEMRETTGGANTPSTSDGISDITFAIRWPQSCGAAINLSMIAPATAGHADYNIITVGTKASVGTDYVQLFGVSTSPFLFPENWTANTFSKIGSIQVSQTGSGTCDFSLETVDVTDNSGDPLNSSPNITMGYAASGFTVADYLPVINNGTATMVPLPVELLSFSAKAEDDYVGLAWASAAEIDFDGYQLERSEDGKIFKEIAWLNGKGSPTTPTTYAYQDEDIIAGRTYYYRLAMLDLDNSIEYSSIEVVDVDAKFVVESFPKPTRDFLNIHIDSDVSTTAKVHLVDICGRLVYEENFEIEKGENGFVLNGATIPNGVYFLLIRSEVWQHAEEVVFLK